MKEILEPLADHLSRAFPFHFINTQESKISVAVKARDQVDWVDVLEVKLEGSILRVIDSNYYRESNPDVTVLGYYDIADPSFEPSMITNAVKEALRSHGYIKKLIDMVLVQSGRTIKKKSQKYKKKAGKRHARKLKRKYPRKSDADSISC